MNARIITKFIDIEEREYLDPVDEELETDNPEEPAYRVISTRKFAIKKYIPLDGFIILKTFTAKILPAFQSFMPIIGEVQKLGKSDIATVIDIMGNYISLDSIAATLDKVSPDDLGYIFKKSLQTVYEILPAGEAQVLNDDGTYGVLDVEHDMLLTLRLVCEAVMWGISDFFDVRRLTSIMSPLFSSLPRNRKM